MGGYQKIVIVGNLGQDPDIKYTQSNIPVANFSVATSESWKDKSTGEWQEETEWFRVVAWRYMAEKAEKMRKGNQVLVEGKVKTRKWTDKDGNERYTTEVVADKLLRTGAQGEGKPAGVGEDGHFNPPPTPASEDDDGDLPF